MKFVNSVNHKNEDNIPSVYYSTETISHREKADLLTKLFHVPMEETGIASGTIEHKTDTKARATTISENRPEKHKKHADKDYVQLIRPYYIKPILQSLQKIQPHAGTPTASVQINKILHTINALDDKSPDDPILEVLFALYDALAYEGLWATYTARQYKEAEEILTNVMNMLNPHNIEKAITNLDKAGFDTIPYQFSLENEDEI